MKTKLWFIIITILLSFPFVFAAASDFTLADWSVAAHAPDNDTGLVFYMPFERGYLDESPQKLFNGTPSGDTLLNNSGAIGRSAQFDGTGDYVTSTVTATITSVLFWAKSPTVGWSHYANVSGTYYVNGTSTSKPTFPVYVVGSTVSIGKTDTSSYYTGKIDEVAIYNRSLSASEIQSYYQKGRNDKTITLGYAPSVSLNSSDADGLSFDVAWYMNGTLNRTTGNVSDANLVAWYPLDNDAKDYKNSYDGTANGNAILNRTIPKIGSGSYAFDGTSGNVNVGDAAIIDGKNAFTIELWFVDNALAPYDTLIGSWPASNGQFMFRKSNSAGTSFLLFIANDVSDGGSNYGTTPSLGYTAGSWHHFTAVFNGSGSSDSDQLKFYYDGTIQNLTFAGNIPSSTTSPSTKSWLIGDYAGGWIWNGLVDDLRIYDKPLSGSKVYEDYLAGLWAGMTIPRSDTANNQNWTIQITPIDSSSTGTISTQYITITSSSSPTDDCTYSGSGDWEIDDGCTLTLSSDTDIGSNHFRLISGSLIIPSTFQLTAGGGCYLAKNTHAYIQKGGGLNCN